MLHHMLLSPAYGRDYTSKAQVLADLTLDKDFKVRDPRSRWYCLPVNATQLRNAGIKTVAVRYDGNRKVALIDVPTAD